MIKYNVSDNFQEGQRVGDKWGANENRIRESGRSASGGASTIRGDSIVIPALPTDIAFRRNTVPGLEE
jgi:hypothetical protein